MGQKCALLMLARPSMLRDCFRAKASLKAIFFMGHGPCSFREADVRRAIKAARSSGIEIARVEVDRDGRIAIIPGKGAETPAENERPNE